MLLRRRVRKILQRFGQLAAALRKKYPRAIELISRLQRLSKCGVQGALLS